MSNFDLGNNLLIKWLLCCDRKKRKRLISKGVKSKQYSNKHLRNSAYLKLIEKMQEVVGTATKDTVVKINNMRSSYRKELKKVAHCTRRGLSGEVQDPSLCYLHMLDFLYDQVVIPVRRL
ncbi:hypothetical protein L798_10303 [Zootermopsis nevadensis]|uniref:MADF domain-containing protein n=1 Tax=Zootermopsis nevadensis TaxID=136037 RepID=A0A067R881_ZOONE|nr:hypothetical protein L798_10303 [Zootermopsis nevadensis]